MHSFFSLCRIGFHQAKKQLWRQRGLAITAILLGGLVIFLLNFVFSVQFLSHFAVQNLENRADFDFPLQRNYDALVLSRLKNELVKDKKFSLEIKLVEEEKLGNLILPKRLRVRFLHLEEAYDIFQTIKSSAYSDLFSTWSPEGERDFLQLSSRLIRFKNLVQSIATGLVTVFVIGGILLMFTTFRMMLFHRRKEIFIARIVGAEPRFILTPFIFEGIFIGFFSAVFGIVLYIFLLREIAVLPNGDIFLHLWYQYFGWEIFFALLVGVFGALIPARNFLFKKLHE